jgi:uncharacterized oxidoreductase
VVNNGQRKHRPDLRQKQDKRLMNIRDKLVVITGGTDGIGLEIARICKAKGGSVIVCGRRQAQLDLARSEGMESISADLSSAAGCADFVQVLAGRPIDILINNAGMGGNFGPGEPLDLALTDQAIFLNLNAPMHLIGHLLPVLLERPEAVIVNVTSGLAIAPRAGSPVYCAAKAGLRSFTQSLRYNLKNSRVRVIEALPPVVDTAMTARLESKKMPPADCAAQIVDAIEANKKEANVGIVKMLQSVYSISPKLARFVMIRF